MLRHRSLELGLPRRVETSCVGASGADTECVRLPPLIEAPMLDADGERGFLDLAQASVVKQLDKVALAGSGQPRLTFDVGREFVRRRPEHAEGPLAALMIPDARGHDTLATGDAGHLAQPHDRVRHEVDDELCQCRVECPICERELLRGCASNCDRGVALPSGGDEGF